MVLADDLGEGVGSVAAVEGKRGLHFSGGLVEQRLVLSVLDAVRSRLFDPQVVPGRFFHACTLCPCGDNPEAVLATRTPCRA
jgi:hypothetical protein